MKIHELLNVPSKWTQFANARTSPIGNYVLPHDIFATCWCLRGAIIKCYNHFSIEYDTVSHKIIDKLNLYDSSITEWNDNPMRTHQEVLELCKKLDI